MVGGTGVLVGGTGVFVGGTGVFVGGTGVFVGGTGVLVGGTGVFVGGTGVFVGGTAVGAGVTWFCAVTGSSGSPLPSSQAAMNATRHIARARTANSLIFMDAPWSAASCRRLGQGHALSNISCMKDNTISEID